MSGITSISPMATSSSTLRRLSLLIHRRYLSSLSSSSSTDKLATKEKSKYVISLIKAENNPDRILDICRASYLSPNTHYGRVAFSIAISKLADLHCFEGISSFVEELKRRPDLQNERFASHSMILYGQAGMIHNAVASFENLEEFGIDRSVKTLNSLLFATIMAKSYDETRRIFTDFPKRYKIKPDLDTYNLLIKAFCESGSSSSGYSIIADMEKAGYKLNETIFASLIEGFYREENLEEVTKVLKMMDGRWIKPGLEVFNIRIKSLCKLRRSVEARMLLDSMISRGIEVNVVSYYHLIHGFCKEGNLQEAKKILKIMEDRGCEPDSTTLFTLIHFSCKGGDIVTAFQLCKRCIRKNWVPYFTTMKLLVEGLSSVSMVDEAQMLIDEVKVKFPKNTQQWEAIENSIQK